MPERNDLAKEPSGSWDGWRNDPVVEPAPGWSIELHQGPSFTFTSPDGQKYTVNGPDGATSEEAFAILQDWMRGNQKAEAPSAEHGPWENYRPPASAGDSRFKVDPGGVLSEFEAAVLEEVLNTPLSELFTGDQRICTESQWYYGPTVGNA
jgi:hypothetical protein